VSEKSVADRLQVKQGRRLAKVDAPAGVGSTIDAPAAPVDDAEVVLLFVTDRAALDTHLPPLLARIRADAILWIAYPKLSSRFAGDLSRDIIHAAAPGFGLATVAQIAVDADWSALRFKRTC
jgi:hypothetical protein